MSQVNRGETIVGITLPLDQMTVDEKLRALEQIWEDLCRNEATIPCPQWHYDVLEAREARSKDGGERFTRWEDAKRRIRESTP
jgi:transposase